MKILSFFYNRPVAVTMFFLALMLLGIVSCFNIPISLLPEIPIGKITVKVDAPGYSSRKLEDEIVKNLRLQLLQLNNTSELNSNTRDNVSRIELSYPFGTDMEMAFIDVNEQIDHFLPLLPKDVERPKVIHSKVNDIPIFYLNLKLEKGTEEEREKLNIYAKNVLIRRLEQLKGVAFVDISGINETEISIRKKPSICSTLNISNKDIENTIKNVLVESKTINLERNGQEFKITFQLPYQKLEDFKNIVLSKGSFQIPLKDICTIEKKIKEPDGYCYLNGKRTISLAIICQNSSRISDLKKDIQKLISEQQLSYPQLQYELINDQSKLLDLTIKNLLQSLLYGLLMVLVIVYLFISNKKLSFLIAVSIPISLLISIFFFNIFNLSINIISLSGLILGIGIMIDNAIIVIDNINQRYAATNDLYLSVTIGTSEIFSALFSSALTTTAIFIPLIFLSGISGALFHDQAIAIATGLFVSLGVSCSLLPVLFKIIKPSSYQKNTFLNRYFFNLYEKGFKELSQKQKLLPIISLLLIIIGFGGLSILKKETMPDITRLDNIIYLNWNEEITSKENKTRISNLYEQINKYTTSQLSWIGRQQYMLGHIKDQSTAETRTYLSFKNKENQRKALDELNRAISVQYPNAVIKQEIVPNLFDFIFTDNKPDFKLKLYYHNPALANPDCTKSIFKKLDSLFCNEKHSVIPTEKLITYELNPEKLKLYHVDYNSLINEVKYNLASLKIGNFSEGKDIYDIVLNNPFAYNMSWIKKTFIINKNGKRISLDILGKQKQINTWEQIISDKTGDYLPYEIHHLKSSKIPKKEIPEIFASQKDWHTKIEGKSIRKNELIKEMIVVIIISILLLYFILAAQFESLTQPLIILLEIPIDLAGVFLMLFVFDSSLNILSMIGIIVMAGIVINDSILKVDTINRLIAKGEDVDTAIHSAGKIRLRPILMTSLTTIFALVPFLFGSGIGNEMQKPLSLVIIGGLGLGTVVSSLFVPFYYKWLYNLSAKNE